MPKTSKILTCQGNYKNHFYATSFAKEIRPFILEYSREKQSSKNNYKRKMLETSNSCWFFWKIPYYATFPLCGNFYLLVTSFQPSSIRLFFFGLVAACPEWWKLPFEFDNETIAHCAAAVAMVAATSELIECESVPFVDFILDIIEVATALVISATVVALTASRGLMYKRKNN